MKRLALLLALLASPASANDNLTFMFWGTTAEAAPCQYANAAAAVASGACTVNLTDTTNTKMTELKAVFQQYCNTRLNPTPPCTPAQILTQIPFFLRDAITAEALRYNTNNATIAPVVPVQ